MKNQNAYGIFAAVLSALLIFSKIIAVFSISWPLLIGTVILICFPTQVFAIAALIPLLLIGVLISIYEGIALRSKKIEENKKKQRILREIVDTLKHQTQYDELQKCKGESCKSFGSCSQKQNAKPGV